MRSACAPNRTAGRTRAVADDSTWKVLPFAFFEVLFFFDFFLAIELAVTLPPVPRPSPPPLFSLLLPILGNFFSRDTIFQSIIFI